MILKVINENCPQNHVCPSLKVCPAGALSQKGFNAPLVDTDKCIKCGVCVKFCPKKALILEQEINITRAEENDLLEILDLQKLAFRENALRYNDFSITPLTQTLEDITAQAKTHIILKAADGSKIVGSVRGCKEGDYCTLSKLSVHPDYQNQGIGRKLIAAIENEFGIITFRFVTGYLDEKNISLYEKLGYKIYKNERIPNDVCSVFMEKKGT